MLGAERWAWAGKLTAGRAEYFYDGIEFWRRGKSSERQALAEAETPADGWWHKPECNCGLCLAPSATKGPIEQGMMADAVKASSPAHETDLRDWPGPQRTAMGLRRPRSPVPLSLAEVRETGLPALLLDFGEALLYLDGEIFEVDASEGLAEGKNHDFAGNRWWAHADSNHGPQRAAGHQAGREARRRQEGAFSGRASR